MSVYPTSDQIAAFVAAPDDGPVVMLNLLRFKPEADSPDEGVSGQEAYAAYGEKMIAFVESKGGRLIWSGRVEQQLIGTGGDQYDMVALVEYPSRREFIEISSEPYVQEIGVHRAAGLESQWLIACCEAAPAGATMPETVAAKDKPK